MPDLVKILLGESASKALADVGEVFLIIGKGSHPDSVGRMVIHCLAVPKELADLACGVALGTHRASRIKKPASETT